MVLVAVAGSYMVKAQFVSERSAMHILEKGKWQKTSRQLVKLMQKDSLHAGASYVQARYFFTSGNPDYHIDSAYAYIQQSMVHYGHTSGKLRQRLAKIPIDSAAIVYLRQRIDSAAFARTRQANTEAAYIDFIGRFSTAAQQAEAIVLRNAVAYTDAVQQNTYQAFLQYIEKYPRSEYAAEAKARYERLLFESKTADQKLATYEIFLKEYPQTPYRKEVEQQIFEKMTAGGDVLSFERFLKKYPASAKARQAKNILYYLLKEDARASLTLVMSDSLRKVQALEKYYLTPFLKDDKFGFLNETGEEVIKPTFTTLPDEYLCGNLTDDVFMADNSIVARNGSVLYKGKVDGFDMLGYGFVLVSNNDCVYVLHSSGFSVGFAECAQDARLLAKNYVLIKKNNRWSVWSFAGRMLTGYDWDNIQLMGDVVAFQKAGTTRLARLNDLAKTADQQQLALSKPYDDVKLWAGNLVWVRSGNEQAVLTQALTEWIKPARHELTQTFFGAIAHSAVGYTVYDQTAGASPTFYKVKVQQPWVVVQHEGSWKVFDTKTKTSNAMLYDSVGFVGPFLWGHRHDSVFVNVSPALQLSIPAQAKVQFLPGKDSLFFLLVEEADKKTVYNAKAGKLFTLTADKIEYNNEGYFTITQKQKKGLLTASGKIMLASDFDAIGAVTAGLVATLKDKKFGLADLARKKIIKPEYDKNIVPYNKTLVVASKNNLFGLMGWDSKPVINFEFEEIQYWNDSTALVKKNFQWQLYNFIDQRVVIGGIKGFKWVENTPAEKIIIAQCENKYGVISSVRGMVVPATFSDVVNVGSPQVPLYFTEKHVEEASIFVVIYYDKNGAQLRKYVYEADDYEKIYCSGK